MKKVFDINILGYRLSISTDRDEKYVNELTAYLNGRLQEVKRENKAITNMDQLILTSLTLADEILNVKKELDEARGRVEQFGRLLDEKLANIQG